MPLSAAQLLAIARDYWRSDKAYHSRTDESPESQRLQQRWEKELKKLDRWWEFLGELEKELPGFTLGDATATAFPSFRCAAYPASNQQRPPLRWAVVGCLSILAPVCTVYAVQYEYSGAKLLREEVFLAPLPPEMRAPADLIIRRIEAAFGVDALPRGLADTPIPLFVEPREPPDTTLFHALFTSQPERLP